MRRAALIAAGLGFFVIQLDTTVVNVAVAAIGDDLDAGIGGLQWAVAGQVVFGLGLAGLLLVEPGTPTALVEALLVPLGVGAGLAIPPLTSALMESVAAAQAELAAGVLNAARQLGSAVGVAVFGALLAGGFTVGVHRAVAVGATATLATVGLTVRFVRSD